MESKSTILSSRRFWSAVIGALVLVVGAFMPSMQEHLDVIAPSVVAIIGIAIGGFTVEDTMRARSSNK